MNKADKNFKELLTYVLENGVLDMIVMVRIMVA